jgi:hypothetical protein
MQGSAHAVTHGCRKELTQLFRELTQLFSFESVPFPVFKRDLYLWGNDALLFQAENNQEYIFEAMDVEEMKSWLLAIRQFTRTDVFDHQGAGR